MGAMWTTTEGDLVTVHKTCQWCHKEASATVDREGFDKWIDGELIQKVWPDMRQDKREILISGTHGACWKEMWKETGVDW